jgi:hypothetical protein
MMKDSIMEATMVPRILTAAGLAVLAVTLTVAAGSAPPAAFPDFGDRDVVLFESGMTVQGELKKRTSTRVYVHDGTKLRVFRRAPAVAFSFGDAEKRADARRLWQKTEDTAAGWYKTGVACARLRLGVEAAYCFQHALRCDPEHEKAHRALGHARFEGTWLDRAEVRKKLGEGYVKVNGALVKKGTENGTGKTTVKEEEKKWPEHGRRLLEEPKRTRSELARFERERDRRSKDAEEFRRQMEKEYLGVPWTQHHEVKTPHYVVQCNSTEAVTKRYALTMEKLYRKLAYHFPPERKGRRGRSVVRIYRNGDDFREQTGMFYGVGGFYRPSTGELCAYHGTFGSTATTFNVLAHEGTHQFQGKVLQGFENIPMWLIEGLAVYFGDGARVDPSGKLVTERIPRDRLLHIQDKIRVDRYERLAKLATLGRRGFSGSHYADSWALIHFLVNSGERGQKLLSAYWNIAQRKKITFDHFEAVAKEHSGSIEALEKEYLKHVMGLRPDPAGEIRGDYFYSREFSFELKRLGPKWRFYEDYRRGFLVGQLLPGTSAEVEVIFSNNDERAQAGKDYVKDYVLRYKNKYLPVRYSNIAAKSVTMHGTKAFRFTYEDGGTRGIGGLTADDLIDELRRRRSGLSSSGKKKKGKPRRYVEYLIVDFDGTFSIKASAEKEEFSAYQDRYFALAELFEPIHERRW